MGEGKWNNTKVNKEGCLFELISGKVKCMLEIEERVFSIERRLDTF